MTDFFHQFLSMLISASLTVAALAFVAKALFAQLLKRDVENHKNELAKDLEQFKRTIDAVQFEHQTRFTVMQERRADVISELYKRMATAQVAVARMASPLQLGGTDKEAQRKEAAEAFEAIRDYFNVNKIFLGQTAADKCQPLMTLLHETFIEFDMSQGVWNQGAIDHKGWFGAWDKISAKFPAALVELEQQFHKILGISD